MKNIFHLFPPFTFIFGPVEQIQQRGERRQQRISVLRSEAGSFNLSSAVQDLKRRQADDGLI